MPVKLHLGCGSVYLEGYFNIDYDGINPTDEPLFYDYLDDNRTTLENYYKRDYCKERSVTRKIVADIYFDIRKIDELYGAETISEILAIQVFEHIPKEHVVDTLQRWFKVLKKGGKVHVDVPDLFETIKLHYNVDDDNELEYFLRLIHGSGKNHRYIHHDSYYPKKLINLFKSVGFTNVVKQELVKHDYPTFGGTAYK